MILLGYGHLGLIVFEYNLSDEKVQVSILDPGGNSSSGWETPLEKASLPISYCLNPRNYPELRRAEVRSLAPGSAVAPRPGSTFRAPAPSSSPAPSPLQRTSVPPSSPRSARPVDSLFNISLHDKSYQSTEIQGQLMSEFFNFVS